MIYDCFTFFNELDILEIRLNSLKDVIDKFVIVEMGVTFTGVQKSFVFEENKNKFEKFLDKIIYIKVTDYPDINNFEKDDSGNKWILESYQRDKILDGLKEAKPDDVIIISDVDEIPNPEAVKQYKSGIQILEQKMMCYFLNNICINKPIWKNGSRIGHYSDLCNPKQQLDNVSYIKYSKYGSPNYFRFCQGETIPNGGWHFSYCGGVEMIKKKITSFSEQQFNNQNITLEQIQTSINKGVDLFNRNFFFEGVPLDDSFPLYILENQEKYKNIIFQITPEYKKNKFKRKLYRKMKVLKYNLTPKVLAIKTLCIFIPNRDLRRKLKKYL